MNVNKSFTCQELRDYLMEDAWEQTKKRKKRDL